MVLCCVEERVENKFLQEKFSEKVDKRKFKKNIKNASVRGITSIWQTMIISATLKNRWYFECQLWNRTWQWLCVLKILLVSETCFSQYPFIPFSFWWSGPHPPTWELDGLITAQLKLHFQTCPVAFHGHLSSSTISIYNFWLLSLK